MGLKEIIERLRESRPMQRQEPDLPDDVTRDKYLRSLRRQRRVQMEEVEKEQLINEIAEYNKQRQRRFLWGMKDEIKQKMGRMQSLKARKPLADHNPILKMSGARRRKQGKKGFLERYQL